MSIYTLAPAPVDTSTARIIIGTIGGVLGIGLAFLGFYEFRHARIVVPTGLEIYDEDQQLSEPH